MRELIDKAKILHEALPYIQRFHGRTFVLKYGGHAMIEPRLKSGFARDVAVMKFVGLNPVIVHGGGPQIDETLASMGVSSQRVDGVRVTDERTMDVVEMVLGGKVNQEIVSLICNHGGRAVGLSGKDDAFMLGRKVAQMQTTQGQLVDPGRVGEIIQVRRDLVDKLVQGGFIPVIAPVVVDSEGASLNVNADFVASKVAGALCADKLMLMTDTAGVLDESGKLLPSLDRAGVLALIEQGVIAGGMIPKVKCAIDAIDAGVKKVHVIDGRTEHAVLLEIFTDQGIGTEIVA
jgi:acetylglutamate kinase